MIEQFVCAMDDGTYITVEGVGFSIVVLGEEFKFFAHLDYKARPACSHANTGKRVCFLERVDAKHAETEIRALFKKHGPILIDKLRKG